MRSTILSRHHLTQHPHAADAAFLSEELSRRHIAPPASAPHHFHHAGGAGAAGGTGKRRASGPASSSIGSLIADPTFDAVWSGGGPSDPMWDDDPLVRCAAFLELNLYLYFSFSSAVKSFVCFLGQLCAELEVF